LRLLRQGYVTIHRVATKSQANRLFSSMIADSTQIVDNRLWHRRHIVPKVVIQKWKLEREAKEVGLHNMTWGWRRKW
jgi:hypothetical protein